MSLYRTYRPRTFADVSGQEHVVTTLENAVRLDRLGHAYLFAGSRGTGKTSVARILAKAIMTKGVNDPVLLKQIEEAVDEGSLVDLLEIDAASNRGIDDIRDLIEKIQFSPVVAAAKVYIIDEVHMLTKEAFNALLKTLEEPPEYAYFILATTELQKIPATIRSRCQCFPFRQIRVEDIVRRLQFIADTEKIAIERTALRAIAQHVGGGMRDAISLLDQLRSLPNISLTEVETRLGATGQEQISAVFSALDARNTQQLLAVVQHAEESGLNLESFIRDMLGHLRDALHAAIADGKPADGLMHMLEILLQALRDMRISPVPGVVLETALLSLCAESERHEVPALSLEESALVPNETPVKAAHAPAPQPVPVAAPPAAKAPAAKPVAEPKHAAIVEAQDLNVQALRAQWTIICEKLEPAAARRSLKDGLVTAVDDKNVTVVFGSTFHRDRIAKPDTIHSLETVISELFKTPVHVVCTVKGDAVLPANGDDHVSLADAAAEIF